MINSFEIKNLGPIDTIMVDRLGKINLFIGPNRSGKTFLLKALYCAEKTIEMANRGKNRMSERDYLANKLYWVFQIGKLGNIVRKSDAGPLSFTMTEEDGRQFTFAFGADTESKIVKAENKCEPRSSNSIFIPAKEVLSLLDLIKYNREVRMEFGFDDTYYDLAAALTPPNQGKIATAFQAAREKLSVALDGRIAYSKEKRCWQYIQGKSVYDINLTSEGTKKIAIFDTLIANHYLSKNSIVFIDEPESGLHPGLLVQLLDIVALLSRAGMQFFIASHSYFVIKKLYLIAKSQGVGIPVVSFDSNGCASTYDLKDGMPENAIINESVKLYEEEICL